MSRRGENIFKHKDGRWEGRFIYERRETGKAKYRSVYAHSYAECSNKLRNAKNDMRPICSPMIVSELYEAWLLSRKNSIKITTYANYRYLFDHYVYNKLGKKQVESLSATLLDRFIDELMLSGGKNDHAVSAKTVRDIAVMLKSVFKYGEQEYMLINHMRNVKLPKSKTAEVEVFPSEDIIKIRSTICETTYETGILLCLYTGLRIGEICALKWKDIDLSANIIMVRKTLTRVRNPTNTNPKTIVIIDTPKSKKSVRDIPIPTFMISMFSDLKSYHSDEDYFLTGSQRYTEPRTYSTKYKRFLKRIEVPHRNFHVLRHTFATECIRHGIDVKTVSELLGHSSVKITLEKYVHSDIELKRSQLEKLYSEI